MWMGDRGDAEGDDAETVSELEVDVGLGLDEEAVPCAWAEEGSDGTGQEGLEDHTSWNGADEEELLRMSRSSSGRLGSGRVVILRRPGEMAQGCECFVSARQRLEGIRYLTEDSTGLIGREKRTWALMTDDGRSPVEVSRVAERIYCRRKMIRRDGGMDARNSFTDHAFRYEEYHTYVHTYLPSPGPRITNHPAAHSHPQSPHVPSHIHTPILSHAGDTLLPTWNCSALPHELWTDRRAYIHIPADPLRTVLFHVLPCHNR